MAAEKAQLVYGSTIQWSGGRAFDGSVLLLMALPSTGGATWTRVSLKDLKPKLRIPTRIKVPIVSGAYDANTRIWRTDSIQPPNVKYAAFFYDSTDRLIAYDSALFTVTESPYTLTPPTLTDPTATVDVPMPEDVPSTQITTVAYSVPTREDVAGTKNGVNDDFTISKTGTIVLLIWNQLVLDEGVHYTKSGVNITMLSPFIPESGDTFEALIW